MLVHAQEVIDAALKAARYAVDTNGNPTDAGIIAALNKATCAQVEWWINNGDEWDQASTVSSYSIEGISVTRSGPTSRQAPLANRARDILASAFPSISFASPLLPGKPTS